MATPAPLAARYTDPALRSLRPVDESYFAARSGERVLITGASGMLGRETAIALLRAGYDVRVFQRSDAGIAALLPDTIRPRFEQVRGSLNNAEVIEQALVGVDGIVHAAAKVSVSGDWEDYERTNIVGTQALLDAAIERSIPKFLYVSSPSVVHAGTALIGEGTGWHPRACSRKLCSFQGDGRACGFGGERHEARLGIYHARGGVTPASDLGTGRYSVGGAHPR